MLTTPGARPRPRDKSQYIVPIVLGLLILIWYIRFPEHFTQNFAFVVVIIVIGAFIAFFGMHFYRQAKYRNLRKQHICPYCKKQNPSDVTNCKYCMYPMDEPYD